jgi:hypothetical protein
VRLEASASYFFGGPPPLLGEKSSQKKFSPSTCPLHFFAAHGASEREAEEATADVQLATSSVTPKKKGACVCGERRECVARALEERGKKLH